MFKGLKKINYLVIGLWSLVFGIVNG